MGSPDALIMAPLWDPHVHLPQLPIAGRYHEPLLEWLHRRVFPEEARHADPGFARRGVELFFAALERAGSVGAGVFAAPFPFAAREALAWARRNAVPLRCGPPLMDIAPNALARPASRWLSASRALVRRHGETAAIVPRFALSCSDRLLRGAAVLARRQRSFILTHIAETGSEGAALAERFPGESYAEVYDRFGLLTPRTLLAHGVHLTRPELDLLRRRGSVLVHCPSSNLALGSGRMPLEGVRAARVRWCLASDVGAGPELNMFEVMETFLRVHRGRARTDPAEAYFRASLAGASALGFGRDRGALMRGRRADFLLVAQAPRRVRGARGAVRELIERSRGAGWRTALGSLVRGGQDPG